MINGMINRVSKSYFTSAAVVALFLLASGDFAAAQGTGSAPRRNIDSAGGIRPRKNPPQQILTDGTWNTDTSTPWSTAASWLGGNIADGAAATANFTFNISATRTITLDTPRTLGIMNIGDSAGGPSNYTIAGASILTFDNGGSNAQLNETSTSGNNTISAPIALNGSLDITNASASNLTLSGGITAGTAVTKTITTSSGLVTVSGVVGNGSGSVAVVQNGPGTLALTQINTYSGNTTIAGGTISLDGDATVGSGTLFLSGGTLSVINRTAAAVISNNINLTADSTIVDDTATAAVLAVFTGTLTGTAGTLTFNNSGADALSDTFNPRFSGGDFTMSRPIVLTSAVGQVVLNDFNTTGTTHTYGGVISGNGGFNRSASSVGTGGLTVFTAANTYTGTTTINRGVLQLGNGGSTGSLSTSSAINLSSSDGVFQINRSNSVTQGTDFSGAAITGSGSLVDIGTGTVTLNVANTYSGGTTLSSGPFTANGANGAHAPSGSAPFLVATADGALGTGNVNLASSGVQLTLTGGVTNNYISDNRTLSMVTGAFANLNFVGTDTISGLVLGGVAQAALGTYGSSASGATFVFNNFFSGTGTLTLIPEPSTWAMTIVGAGLLLSVQRFRRKKSLR
jgi:autotransporter-associated beta strand protein